MATCREIYHQTAPMYYGVNTFQIFRGYDRDFVIPRSLEIPFYLFRNLVLLYPRTMGVGSHTSLSHAWNHYIRDAHQTTSKFRHLDGLQLSLAYDYEAMLQVELDWHGASWDDILERPPGISDAQQARRVRGIILGFNQLEGRRMPACVSFLIRPDPLAEFNTIRVRDNHDLERLNEGLRLATSHR